jgi:hypothetical protein
MPFPGGTMKNPPSPHPWIPRFAGMERKSDGRKQESEGRECEKVKSLFVSLFVRENRIINIRETAV